MKKLIYLLLILVIPVFAMPQKPMNEKQALKESHIDFNSQYLFFEIHGLIEVGGHTFSNDTCKNPIIYYADAEKVQMYFKNDTLYGIPQTVYRKSKCNKNGCKILHLVEVKTEIPEPYYGGFKFTNTPGLINLNDSRTLKLIQD